MDTTTLFLVQLWGPVLLAVGIGLLVSKRQYAKVYKDIAGEPLAALAFGILAMAGGLAQILVHNTWNGLADVIVSLLGWGTFLKGTVFVLSPGYANKLARSWERAKLMPLAVLITIVVGAYLTWLGYLG